MKDRTNRKSGNVEKPNSAQKLGTFRVGNVSVTAWEKTEGERSSQWISPAQKSYREDGETKYTSSLHERDILNAIECQRDALSMLRRLREERN